MKRSTPRRQDTKLRQGAVACGTRGMKSVLALLVVALVLVYTGSAAAAAEVACNSDLFIITTSPTSVEYERDVPFVVEILPDSGDWPTTPTAYYWDYYSEAGRIYIVSSSSSQEFVFPPPDSLSTTIHVTVTGPGIRPECPVWWATAEVPVKLKGYVEPTITPTPIPTPPPPCEEDICEGKMIYPLYAERNIPLDFIAECLPGTAILGVETVSGSHQGNLEQLAEGRYRVSGLLPDRTYMFYFYCGQDCNDKPVVLFHGFYTGKEPHAGAAWLITGADGASSATLSLVGAEEPTTTTQISLPATGDCIEQTDAEGPQ